jgi:peptidoglycan/LPS O-acetylase OafA/YrhL
MVWLSRRTNLPTDVVIALALYLGTLPVWGVVPNFALFAYCFYLGVALPKFLSNDIAVRWLGSGFGVLVGLALLLPIEYLYVSNRLWMPHKFLIDTLVSGYVIAFVLLRPDCSAARFLDRPILVWLGDVSYSFYCYAMSVLIAVAWALLLIAPETFATSDLGATAIVLASVILCIAVSLVVARLSFVRVEVPCMAIGRLWSKRIAFGNKRANAAKSVLAGTTSPSSQL